MPIVVSKIKFIYILKYGFVCASGGGFGNSLENHNGIYMTWSSLRCPLLSHSLVCIKNNLFIVGIGPIFDKEL